MINIFDDGKTKLRKKKKHRKLSHKNKKQNEEIAGKENLSKLNPMAYPILALHYNKKRPSEWIVTTFKTINEKPHHLTDKWINSINKWVSGVCDSMSLDEPDIQIGNRIDVGPIEIIKIKEPNMMAEFPSPAVIARDERGWKWFFKTSKAYLYKDGDFITLRATISSHGEGITFLKRPSKISKLCQDMLAGEE